MKIADCIILGGGPAGMEAARILTLLGFQVILFEKDPDLGGKLRQWDRLFPDFTSAQDILSRLKSGLENHKLEIKSGHAIQKISSPREGLWEAVDADGTPYPARSILLSTGFDLFDARRKEEYGYGIYPNVITSVELEERLRKKDLQIPGSRKENPGVAFAQCVGSRDEKVGNHYCSRNCCICAVKQAIELKELLPRAEVSCYYMDLRMFGQSYEELYRKAQQEHRVHFIRGRVSEVSPTLENRVVLKAEDTLLSRPVRSVVDLVVLMVGMEPSESTRHFSGTFAMGDPYGYILSAHPYTEDNRTRQAGLFVAGSAKRPMAIPDVVADAAAAAYAIQEYLLQNDATHD